MEIRWLEAARADIDDIFRHIEAHDPRAADKVFGSIIAAVQALGDLPQRGRRGRWPGTRELVVPRTPYVIPYRVRGEVIEILRVFHGARRWPDKPPGTT
jgi:toxin ParE1/3/4